MKSSVLFATGASIFLAITALDARAQQTADELSCNSGQIVARDPSEIKEFNDRQNMFGDRMKQLTGYEKGQAKFLQGLLDSFKKDGTQAQLQKSFAAAGSDPGKSLSEDAINSIRQRVSKAFQTDLDNPFWHGTGTPDCSGVIVGYRANRAECPTDGFTDANRPPIYTNSLTYYLWSSNDNPGESDEPASWGANAVVNRNIQMGIVNNAMNVSVTSYFAGAGPYNTLLNKSSFDPEMPREITTTIDLATGKITQTIRNADNNPLQADSKYFANVSDFLKGTGSMPQGCPNAQAGLNPAPNPQSQQNAQQKAPASGSPALEAFLPKPPTVGGI